MAKRGKKDKRTNNDLQNITLQTKDSVSGISFIMYVNSQKSNNNTIFEGKKTKGSKQDSQNSLKLPMPEKD
jgi:hypothetical protein